MDWPGVKAGDWPPAVWNFPANGTLVNGPCSVLEVLESGEERYILPSLGIDCRIVQPKAWSLYWLSYPGSSLYANQDHSPPSVRHVAFLRNISRGEPLTYNERHIQQDLNGHFSNESRTSALIYHAATQTAQYREQHVIQRGTATSTTIPVYCTGHMPPDTLWLFYRDARFDAYTCVNLCDVYAKAVRYCSSGPVAIFVCLYTRQKIGTFRDVIHRPEKGVPGTRVPKCNLMHARRNVRPSLCQLSRNLQKIGSITCRPLPIRFAKIGK